MIEFLLNLGSVIIAIDMGMLILLTFLENDE
jgi:hypothetical protein